MRASDGDVSEDHGDGDLAEGVTRHGVRRWSRLSTATRAIPPTQWGQPVLQYSANWVLIEVLEGGYGHSFGILCVGGGARGQTLISSATVSGPLPPQRQQSHQI